MRDRKLGRRIRRETSRSLPESDGRLLQKITLLHDRVQSWNECPFSLSAIRELKEITFRSRICFFAGENGTGKSTLLEAIAAPYGFGREGGNRSFRNDSTESNQSIDPLVKVLRLSFEVRTGQGFFLRAESFFNTASHIDDLGPRVSPSYGGRSLHTRSYGETFLTLLDLKFRRNGLFLLDEPEAALSPQRQLSFLVLIHDVSPMHSSSFLLTLLYYSHARTPKSCPSTMDMFMRLSTSRRGRFRWSAVF